MIWRFKEYITVALRYLAVRSLFAIPYVWFTLFLLVPLLIVWGISFSESMIRIPPYEPLLMRLGSAAWALKVTFSNYLLIFHDRLYALAYLNSFKMAFYTTVLCLLLAYPAAYGLVNLPPRWRFPGLVLMMAPFWISFLVRIYAWIGLLNDDGLLCLLFRSLGWLGPTETLIGTQTGVLIGLVYTYLPFMVLPLYTALEKVDDALVEAALDLGCRPLTAFWRIVVPMSWRGALTGAMLVLIPVVGEFVVPELLGGNKVLMIGQVVWGEFFYNHDWPAACALAIAMLITLVPPIVILGSLQRKH